MPEHTFRNLTLKSLLPFRKRTKSPSPPQVTRHTNLSTQAIPASPGFAPPDLGEDGWGTKAWEKVRPDRDRLDEEDDQHEQENEPVHTKYAPSQTRRSISTTRSSIYSSPKHPHTPRRTISLTSTPPRRSTPAPRRRAPSTVSRVSSTPSQTARSVSGSSFTSTGANARAEVRGKKGEYTKEGIRIASDGYVGRWRDPEREVEGVTEVWRGHPALQAKPWVEGGSSSGGGGGGGGEHHQWRVVK